VYGPCASTPEAVKDARKEKYGALHSGSKIFGKSLVIFERFLNRRVYKYHDHSSQHGKE
jgi:hypothetical protein